MGVTIRHGNSYNYKTDQNFEFNMRILIEGGMNLTQSVVWHMEWFRTYRELAHNTE